jgi:hypothetical protein
VAVFTAWPELINDQHSQFQIVFDKPCLDLIQNTFESQDVGANLERYVAWVHDRHWYAEFEYCLFVSEPSQIEISDFLLHLDPAHTTYSDADGTVILYKRGPSWLTKVIDLEKDSITTGVIFIDCWQQIAEQSAWSMYPQDFDFYARMKQQLLKYKIKSLVFHTGEYGSLPLSTELQSWKSNPRSCDIMDLTLFQQHYQKIGVTNWIVVGAHWQRCTHDKPLGFLNLLELKKQDPVLKIYSDQKCTAKFINNDLGHPILATLESQDYAQDTLYWKSNGNLFELMLE